MIAIEAFNATFVKVRCEDYGVEQELSSFFEFFVPGYKFMPAFRSGVFDGKVRLYNLRTKCIYRGLVDVVVKFAETRQYPITVDPTLDNAVAVTLEQVKAFMQALNLHGRGKPVEIREYQYEAVLNMIQRKRGIVLSATSSGKSLMIYSTIRYHLSQKRRVLLLVPTVNLVNQMYSDFEDYSSTNGWDVAGKCTLIYSGKDRDLSKPVTISTWQTLASIQKNDPKLYKQITANTDVLIADETHQFKSTVTSKVIEGFVNTEYRIGMSGTLDGTNINELTLTGLLGPVYRAVTAKEMMDRGQVTDLQIKILLLKHPERIRKAFKGMEYKEEVKHIVTCEARNRFISNLATACTGNALILFNYVSHGTYLYEKIRQAVKEGRSVYFIHGGVDSDERERVRLVVEQETDAIILATSSLFSTGTNIPSLENLIFAIPTKSNIRVRQSIGRGLRLKEGKTSCKVFDIADDFRTGKNPNVTYRHMEERIAIYTSEQFKYKLVQLDLDY